MLEDDEIEYLPTLVGETKILNDQQLKLVLLNFNLFVLFDSL